MTQQNGMRSTPDNSERFLKVLKSIVFVSLFLFFFNTDTLLYYCLSEL